jgi:prepilin-type N-terminal cleavage/methylation domain-containing protein
MAVEVLMKARREKGMTLIEVLVALAILSLVMLSVIGLFTQSMVLTSSGMDYTMVNNLARDRLEGLMSVPFNGATLTVLDQAGTAYSTSDLPVTATEGFDRTYYVRELRLAKDNISGDPTTQLSTGVVPGNGNIKEIVVTVRSNWSAMRMGRREIQVRALRVDGLRY